MMGGERLSIDKYREDLALYLVASCTDAGLRRQRLSLPHA